LVLFEDRDDLAMFRDEKKHVAYQRAGCHAPTTQRSLGQT